jgi:hypothetical protein
MSNPTFTFGFTFTGAPPQLGELYYVSGDYTVSRAQASAFSTSKVVGIYPDVSGALATTSGAALSIHFVPGLTLSPGDTVYLSPTVAGAATNVAPSAAGQWVAPQGILLSVPLGAYSSLTGGTALVVADRSAIYGAIPA